MRPQSLLALAVCLLALQFAAAAVNNTVTQWENLAEAAVRTYGIPNQLSTR